MIRSACGLWFVSILSALSACHRPQVDAARLSNTTRWVVTPSAIASLSADHETQGLPGTIVLGGPFGRSALYLKFPNQWREHGHALQAFLTLTPSHGTPTDDETVSVETWRVKSDWRPGQLHGWPDKPELGPPFARGYVTSAPARELRIDVTELVRFAAENPERDFGLALIAKGSAHLGASFATGMTGDAAPRLEVYLH